MISAIILGACSEMLDPIPNDGSMSDDYVWDNPSFSRGVLYYGYNGQGIPGTFRTYGGDFTEIATDDAVSNKVTSTVRNMGLGQLSANNNVMNVWDMSYKQIRNLNIFLVKGVSSPYDDDLENNKIYDTDSLLNERLIRRYKGEALYLRAWYHWRLLKNYGCKVDGVAMGVPVVTSILDLDEAFAYKRSTYAETIEAIKADCDSAATYLPDEYTGTTDIVTGAAHTGGATTHACRALKALAFTFAASPAYEATTWDVATQYLAEALIALDGPLNSAALPSRDLFNPEDQDVIWRSVFIANFALETQNFPPSFYGNGETNPSQNLVDAFPLASGYPIKNADGTYHPDYDPQNPYSGRDPRLSNSILYDGSFLGTDEVETYEGGKDSRAAYKVEGTKTSYYLKKFISTNVKLYPQEIGKDNSFYVALGKTNLYLYLAEALHHSGYTNTAHGTYGVSAADMVNKVRARAGLSSAGVDQYLLDAAQDEAMFTDLVRTERRVELCFEDNRFWDLRRWDMQVDDVPVYGMKITVDSLGQKEYYTDQLVETRKFMEKSLPLPFKEVSIVDGVVQNPGW